MRKTMMSVFVLIALLAASILTVFAAPPNNPVFLPTVSRSSARGSTVSLAASEDVAPLKNDNLPDPLSTKQLALREKGLDAKLNGKAYGKTYEVARGQYVELVREGEGAIWTVLGEFGLLINDGVGLEWVSWWPVLLRI